MDRSYCHTKANHRSGSRGKFCHYSVWDNRTDELVICDGDAEQCARAMWITVPSFWCALSRSRKGKNNRWHIEQYYLDEEDICETN